METADIIIVGAGIAGSAIAFGLIKKGHKVVVIDGARGDFRASRANFGLVWVQNKGKGFPAYQQITQKSAADWRVFAEDVRETSGLKLTAEQQGGLVFCLGQAEWKAQIAKNNELDAQQPERTPDAQMLNRAALQKMLPETQLGPDVFGASFGRTDGATNPLELLASLHRSILNLGGRLHFQTPVQAIRPTSKGFEVEAAAQKFAAEKIVLAAGLSTPQLAAPLGMTIPLTPQRGQILVTERVHRFLQLPASGLRQTAEGTVMIGATQENVGFNTDTTADAAAKLAHRATQIVPALQHATIVRQWAGLRVLSPDGGPIYAQSARYPGAFFASCHSGITLAAFHANEFADAVSFGRLDEKFSAFAPERFDV